MKSVAVIFIVCLWACPFALAGSGDGCLDVYWTDVEGGAATLIVTPAGESVLIDTGVPGERDPGRILDTVKNEAGLERIDHLVVTHFDTDHYGGTADIARQIDIGMIYDPGLPKDNDALTERLGPYLKAAKGRRKILGPGDSIELKHAPGSERLELRCLAAAQKFVKATAEQTRANPECSAHKDKDTDTSQNAESIVLLLSFGPFRLLDAADLTWNLEKRLVCPDNLVGAVDVFQVNHHGLDRSNNPVLIRTIRPRVAVMNNGHKKGCQPETFRTLSETRSIKAMYQVHRNINAGPEGNTDPKRIANLDQECEAEIIKLSVEPSGKRYTVSIPSKKTKETFKTKGQP